jgi:hypothetical protein
MAEISGIIWFKPSNMSVTSGTTARYLAYIYTDANNNFSLTKTTAANTYALDYQANNTDEQTTVTLYDDDWHSLGFSISDTGDYCKLFLDGVLMGTDTGIGTWSGAEGSTTTVLGSSSTTAADVWSGWMAHWAFWNTPLSNSEHQAIGTMLGELNRA